MGNLLGVKQLVVGVNKMDADTAGPYSKDRHDEVGGEMKNMLIKVGWKKDFVGASVPVFPISGWMGDNLLVNEDICKFSLAHGTLEDTKHHAVQNGQGGDVRPIEIHVHLGPNRGRDALRGVGVLSQQRCNQVWAGPPGTVDLHG